MKAKEFVLDSGQLKTLNNNIISKVLTIENGQENLIAEDDVRVPNLMYLASENKRISCCLFELQNLYDKQVFGGYKEISKRIRLVFIYFRK